MRFSELDGASVGVWGAGREISSFARQLSRRLPSARIAVVAFDEPPPSRAVRELTGAGGARVVSGPDVLGALAECELVVRSPGVSTHRAELQALRERGIPVTTATGLWLAEHGGRGVIGVTGTKGKSTTAALAVHLARAAGRTAELAGNIGLPALELLDREPAEVTVLELSSYQIADLERGPEIALLTNLFREHTEWHGSEEAYRADKLRLLALPGVRLAVLNAREEGLMDAVGALAPRSPEAGALERRLYGTGDGWDVREGRVELRGVAMLAGDALPLPGEHNALNLCGALSALEALGVEVPALGEALAGFSQLPHRLESVLERDGILWVNDSISTTPESTIAALASFPGRELILIAGGQDRGQDHAALARALADRAAGVIGVPSTGPSLLAAARAAGLDAGRASEAVDLAAAVGHARSRARPGNVVLLSPAAPSFDAYRDFEERGERFRELVLAPQEGG